MPPRLRRDRRTRRLPAEYPLETGVNRTAGRHQNTDEGTRRAQQILDPPRPPAHLLFTDILSEHPRNDKGNGVRLAIVRYRPWKHVEYQQAENVAGSERERNARDVFDNLAPIKPGVGNDRNLVVQAGDNEHASHRDRSGQDPNSDRAAISNLSQLMERKTERQRNNNRRQPQI